MAAKKIISSRPIIETHRLSVFEDTIEVEGEVTKRLRVTHPGAVVILAMTSSKQLVVIDQYRRAVGERILELPAGTLEQGEDPLECAKRELAEETGYSAGSWQSLGQLYPAPGFCNELQHLFFANDLKQGQAYPEASEDILCKCIEVEEIRKRVKSLDILDAKTLATLYRAELLGLLGDKC